jgi:hypothetical protein
MCVCGCKSRYPALTPLGLQSNQLGKLPEGSQITKALNCILLKILQSIDQTLGFKILLRILSDSLRSQEGRHNTKNIQLVQRCIWKLVKMMPESLESIRADELITCASHRSANPSFGSPLWSLSTCTSRELLFARFTYLD